MRKVGQKRGERLKGHWTIRKIFKKKKKKRQQSREKEIIDGDELNK